MNTQLSSTTPVTDSPYFARDLRAVEGRRRSVCWGAILAGLTAAIALEVLFMLLGAGLGFAIYSPLTDSNPVAELGTGAAVIQGLSAVVSLWFGGWVAGRFTPVGARASGWLHGFSVWAGATVAGVLVVALGAGWVLGDLSKLVGGGLAMAGKPAAAIASGGADLAKDALKQSTDTMSSFVDEAVGNRPASSSANLTARAKREVSLAVGRVFNPMPSSASPAENRAALVKALVDHAGLSQPDAERAVTEWTSTYDRVKADLAAAKEAAEQKAREAGEKAANALAIFSLCYFVALALGAASATMGGNHGAACATRCEAREPTVV